MTTPPSAESQRVFAPHLFADQVAIISGGGSGIGLATTRELLRLGGSVAICGRTQARLDDAVATLTSELGPEAAARLLAVSCDIRAAETVEAFVGAVLDRFGRVDVLVNNAGGQFPAPAHAISANGFAAVIKNNLCGTFNMTREVATRAMIPARRGRVLSVTANTYRGFPGMVHTGAARAGVENMTMTLAVEWAQFGILINALAPGIIQSSGTARYPPAILAHGIRNTPLKRAGTVEEVAAAILFLVSPGAQFITGATLRMDGGQSLWGDTLAILDPA